MKHHFRRFNIRGTTFLFIGWGPISLFLYAVFLCLVSLYFVNPQWDEYLDFAGCVGAANHLLAFLRGGSTDISTITSDLEWYGNSFRWPAYLLWALQNGFPVQIQGGPQSYDQFLLSGFSSSIHVTAVCYAVLGVYIYSRIITKLSINRLVGSASIFCFCLSPFWLSNATWNLKDMPVAVSLLFVELLALYSPGSYKPFLGSDRHRFWIVSVTLAFILATKYAYLPLVALLSFIYVSSRYLYNYAHPISYWMTISSSRLIRRAVHVLRDVFFQVSGAFVLSLFLTPQILGNPLYPLRAINYFFRHPVVSVNRDQAISFFISRFSYLISPAFFVLIFVASLGLLSFFRGSRLLRYCSLSYVQVSSVIVCAFCFLPFLFCVVPVLISGRSFYGPDLRHIIWIYPPCLLFVTISAQYALLRCSKIPRLLLRIAISASVLISLIELLMIAPHFYSYLGVLPLHSGQQVIDSSLILSRYSPGRTPELHRDLILSCAQQNTCSTLITAFNESQPLNVLSSWSFPLNPSYYKSYLRLGDSMTSSTFFSHIGYSLTVDQSDPCPMIEYGRKWPTRSFSSLKICKMHIRSGLQ